MSLLLPAVEQSREAARRTTCANNLKQIGLAIEGYRLAKTVYPTSNTDELLIWESGGLQKNHSWASLILPFTELAALHSKINFKLSSTAAANQPAASTFVPLYRCPSYMGPEVSGDVHYLQGKFAIGNYVSVGASDVNHLWGVDAKAEGVIIPVAKIKPSDVTDGLSHTMLIAESREEGMRVWIDGRTAANTALRYALFTGLSSGISLNATPYYRDGDITCNYGPSSMHAGGAYHLFGDGSVHFLTDNTPAASYVAFCTRAGAEIFDHVD